MVYVKIVKSKCLNTIQRIFNNLLKMTEKSEAKSHENFDNVQAIRVLLGSHDYPLSEKDNYTIIN